MLRDLREAYPNLGIAENTAVWDMLSLIFNRTGQKFIFVMDEWDDVFHMATRIRFSEYFGFTDEEVDLLYQKYMENTKKPQITRGALREWYDGYHTAAGERLYNPRSVVCALTDNQLSNYWVSSGKYDSIFAYMQYNVDEIQNDLPLLFAGEKIPSGIQEYAATAPELKTKEEIYSAMVVYGLLTYEDGMVFIPNKELMGKWESVMIKRQKSMHVR